MSTDTPSPSRLRLAMTGFIVSGITMVFGLVIVEAGLRLAHIHIPLPNTDGDRELGFRGQPASTEMVTSFPEYGDGTLRMRTNNRQFFEDSDTATEKEPGTRRVAFLGDSQTAGGCLNPESYPNVFEMLMNQRDPEHPVEALNGGVGRYSPYQYLERARIDMVPLKPDEIVFGIYVGNDLLDTTRTDDRPYLEELRDGSFQVHKPTFIVFTDPDNQGNFITNSETAALLSATVGGNLRYVFTRFFMLMHNINNPTENPWHVFEYMNETRKLSAADLGFMTQMLNQHVWFQFFPDTLPRARRTHAEVLRRAKQLFEQHGIKFTVLLVPAKLQIEPQTVEDTIKKVSGIDQSLTSEKLLSFLDQYTEMVKTDAATMGIKVIDPRQRLREAAQNRELYYHQDMHLNVTGNRILANILADELR